MQTTRAKSKSSRPNWEKELLIMEDIEKMIGKLEAKYGCQIMFNLDSKGIIFNKRS